MNDNPPLAAPRATPSTTITITLAGRTFKIGRFAFLLVMGALVGAATGLVTVVFRLAAVHGERYLFPYFGDPLAMHLWSLASLRRILMPALGGLLCGFLLFRLGKYQATHHMTDILQAVASGRIFFEKKMLVPPALAIVTLATGGSAGPEGPIAEIGSVMGSQMGRWVTVPPKMIKTLIGAGVAAGIAAVFNAPIGGMFFAIEVILRNYEMASFTPIAVAAVVASAIANAALGDHTAILVPSFTVAQRELPLFALLGLLCGLLSIYYIRSLGWCHRGFRKLDLPLWLKPMVGGLLVGLLGIFFPQVMGEGYEWIHQALLGHGTIVLLLGLVVLKALATGITLGSGNPGGSFAPAVFIGVMAGAAYGSVLVHLHWAQQALPYAVMGMAGMIAGALGAPLTAMMIALRHTEHETSILLPVMTTVALCAFVMQFRRGMSVYTHDFLRRGIDLDQARQADPLSLVKISAVMHRDGFEVLPSSMTVNAALERFKEGNLRWFIVHDEGHPCLGIVGLHELRVAIAEDELARLLLLSDIVDTCMPRLHPELNLREALVSFNATEAEVLPVFQSAAPEAAFIGVISRQDALNAYYEFTELT